MLRFLCDPKKMTPAVGPGTDGFDFSGHRKCSRGRGPALRRTLLLSDKRVRRKALFYFCRRGPVGIVALEDE